MKQEQPSNPWIPIVDEFDETFGKGKGAGIMSLIFVALKEYQAGRPHQLAGVNDALENFVVQRIQDDPHHPEQFNRITEKILTPPEPAPWMIDLQSPELRTFLNNLIDRINPRDDDLKQRP